MAMTDITFTRMLNLDDCVTLMCNVLTKALPKVNEKYKRFMEIASAAKNPTEAVNAVRDSDDFDIGQLVDCELLALVINL